jgi:ADP-L-glycero-D-manno-heptose 6-epimerase
MIVITGAAGFIGSHFCRKLNFHGIHNIILVDDFTQVIKRKNWENLEYVDKIDRDQFFYWAEKNVQHIDYIFHLGARTDYFSTDNDIFEVLNIDFSQKIWSFATNKGIPFVYASSYLTNDIEHQSLFAKSKYIFDKWVEKKQQMPPFWAGLKFFQVYSNAEDHKAENASMVYKMYKKYIENCTLFRVEKNIIQDYIYVNDVTKVLYYFLNHAPKSSIYEVGAGYARPLNAIVDAINKIIKPEQKLSLEIENKNISYLTSYKEADLALLRKYAYKQAFLSLEQGVKIMF